MGAQESFIIRPYRHEDRNFIMSTCLRGLYYGNVYLREIPKDVFMNCFHKVLDIILTNPASTINVACLSDDQNVILGYSVFRGQSLDWVFVKSAWRKIGIGRRLIPKNTTSYSQATKNGMSFFKSKLPSITYNPFA